MIRLSQILFSIIILVSLFNSCSKDVPTNKTDNLNGGEISAFGHAGMGLGFKYPIDTYQSIEPCLKIGADGSEMDVQVTKDSVLVVYHDTYLEEGTLCKGKINDQLWSEIWGCHRVSPISSSINLISFEDLMNGLTTAGYNIHDFTFTFDCKLYSSTNDYHGFINQYSNAVIKIVDEFQLQDNLLIESQDTTFLRLLQNKRSGLKLFIYPSSFDNGFQIAKSMHLFGMTIYNKFISAAQSKIAHDNGIRVTLWGINTEQDNVDAILKSPDYIQSDKIIHLLKVFGKYKHNVNS